MEEIKLDLKDDGRGTFYILEDAEQMGEMGVKISGSNLTAYHTEVREEAEGKGLAKKLLAHMVSYSREHKLQVVPLCSYVHAQFKRHPELYADVWKNQEGQG